MRIFGKPLAEGRVGWDDGRARAEAFIEKIPGGFKVTGSIGGRPGRLEIFRAPAPARFLLNNWQSWGPMQAVTPDFRFPGLAERMSEYSRYVFTPVPEVFARTLVSDYFAAWEENAVGFLSSRAAHPYFALEGSDLVGFLEYFGPRPGDAYPLEPLVILEGRSMEELLETYAGLAALENGLGAMRPNPVGWSSWYQYFTELTPGDVAKNLRLAKGAFPFEVFQIDDGYERDIGDWLDVKEGFGPLAELAGLIRGEGFLPGIWTAPFSASESSSLFRRNRAWFVSENGAPKPCYRNWGKTIYALDTTHPDARQWLFDTILALRRMGFAYFKVDFLFAAAMDGGRHAAVSPIQAYRSGMDVLRRAAGPDFILGCGAPLLPSLGFVDGMRVGEDTAPFWSPAMSGIAGPNAYIALKNSILRSLLHGRWWLNDPDCLLLREKDIRLSPGEKRLYALACGALDNMLIESDDLGLVDERGKALLLEAIALRGGTVRVRGLMEDDLYVIESSGGPAGAFRLAANLSDRPVFLEGTAVGPRSAGVLPKA